MFRYGKSTSNAMTLKRLYRRFCRFFKIPFQLNHNSIKTVYLEKLGVYDLFVWEMSRRRVVSL